MNKNLLIVFLITLVQLGSSQDINPETAQKVAEDFYKYSNPKKVDLSKNPLILSSVIKSEKIPLMYIFNTKENNGFVLVTSSSKLRPILAYSFNKPFALENISPSVREYLESYKSEILFSIKNEIQPSKTNSDLWNKYKSSHLLEKNLAKNIDYVEPLIETNWGQGCFYNESCPIDALGNCDRVVTGCVATAMAQILKYHSFPDRGTSSHQYYHYVYGELSAEFNETVYNWDNMPNILYEDNSDVAELMFNCGVSVNMYYGPNGSGAPSSKVPLALINYFNYQGSAEYISKVNYSSEEWTVLITNEITNNRPVYYAGSGPTGGHAFIVDGFQYDFFHVNWGWGGNYDGYFYLDQLVSSSGDFSSNQKAIIGIQPNLNNTCDDQRLLVGPVGALNDGSGHLDYLNNSNCQWLIQPSNSFDIKLNILDFRTVENEDFLNVYDGETNSDPLIASFSGSDIPEEIVSSSSSMLVEFVSDGVNTESGWLATYKTTSCNELQVYNSSSGTINDGSGTNEYTNELNCSWLIDIESESGLVFEFSEFKTEAGFDSLFIYDGLDETAPLIAALTGDIIPPLFYSTYGTAFVNFKTDQAVVDNGWTLNYSISESIKEDNVLDINIYPNPVDEVLNIDLGYQKSGQLSLFNAMGQLILKQNLNCSVNIVDISEMLEGAYFVEIESDSKRIIKKVIIF